MWIAVLLFMTASQVLGQVNPGQAVFQWGWQQQVPPGSEPATSGQYYVHLPQAQQSVRYTADNSGYHGAFNINTSDDHYRHTASFALGEQAVRLLRDQNAPLQNPAQQQYVTNPQILLQNQHPSLDYYLLQQQYTPINQNVFPVPNNIYYQPTPFFHSNNYIAQHSLRNTADNKKETVDSPSLPKEIDNEPINNSIQPILQVFKDYNCSEDKHNAPRDLSPIEQVNFLGNQGTAKSLQDGNIRHNSRSERVLVTYDTTTAASDSDDESSSISQLVKSTQDLISNDDLLYINHAAEKYNGGHNDDDIKPKEKFSLRQEQTNRYNYITQAPKTEITVRAKLGSIVYNDIVNLTNDRKNRILTSNQNEPGFKSPIVVQDDSVNDFKQEWVNNIVSTVSPYLAEGYEVTDVRNTVNTENFMNAQENAVSSESLRPLGQKYLTPITVALRLHNSNDSDVLNNLDDFQVSDSEIVSKKVKPDTEKTIVEIQESIPLETIHINEVEYHQQYLEDGKPNKGDNIGNMAKTLYDRYVQDLESSKKIQNKITENFYKYGMMTKNQSEGDQNSINDSEDYLQPSENIQTNYESHPDEETSASHQRNSIFDHLFPRKKPNKLIQPIIIEKEVPVTKYVDRYIDKPVPEPVEVIKEVNKPFVLPVPYEKIVEKPVEVTRYVDKPYGVPQPYPVEIKVPYPVEQKIYVDRPIHIPYHTEKVIEKQFIRPVAVPTAVPYGVPVEQKVLYPVPVTIEIEKPVPVETIIEKRIPVPYPVDRPVPYETKVPIPVPVEKKVPVTVTVEKIVEKPYPVTQYVEKPVRVEVPVPKPIPVPYGYPQPYPVDRIVEKKVPYPVPVDRIVEKKVPYPVETIVEKPVVVNKYVDRPYPVETRVPYPVEKIVEKKVPYPVKVPYEVKVPYPVEKIVEKPVHIPVKVPYAVQTLLPVPYSSHSYSHSKYSPNEHKLGLSSPYLTKSNQQQVQSVPWGNFYASSYQHHYVNNSKDNLLKRSPLLSKYLEYVTNVQNSRYFGPPPVKSSKDSWNDDSGDSSSEYKLRRTDRMPKLTNLRLEYGFKPPLIPSTEVDLDGIPINKEES